MAAMLSSNFAFAFGSRVLKKKSTTNSGAKKRVPVTRVVASKAFNEDGFSVGAIAKSLGVAASLASTLPAVADEIELQAAAESAVELTTGAAEATASAADAAPAAAADATAAADAVAASAADAAAASAAAAAAAASDAVATAADAVAASAADAAAAASDAVATAADAATAAAATLVSKFGGIGGGVSGALSGATAKLGGLSGAASGALGGFTGSASDALGGAASKLSGSVSGALGGAASGFGGTVSGAAKSALPVLGGAAKAFGDDAQVVGKVFGDGAGAVSSGLGAAGAVASQAGTSVTSFVGARATQVTSATGFVAKTLESALPPELADVIALASRDSDVAVALAVAVVGLPVALYAAVGAIRGYAGNVNAFVLDEQLTKNGKAFLIDTRSELDRVTDGVPDLRGPARSKAAAIAVETLDESVRKRTKNARLLELEIAAKKVTAVTSGNAVVYVLGPDAAALARQIETLPGNRTAFVVTGGFEAWRSGGLKVRSNGRYDKNALDSFGEQTAGAAAAFTRKVSAAAGTARTTLTSKNPTETVPILLGLLGVTAAAVNYETSLQFLGVLGVELTIINKITSYGSPLALLEDVKKGAGSLADVVGKVPVSAVAMPGKPSTPPPPPAKKEAPVGAWPPPGAKVKAERIKDMKAAKTEDKVPVVKKEEKAPVEEKKVPEVKVEETPVDKKEKQVIAKTEDGSFVFSADAEDKSPDTLPEEKVEQKKDM